MTAFARPNTCLPSKAPGWKPGARVEADYYPTPPSAVRALLDAEQFEGALWEPACGSGAISKVLIEHGHVVVSTDLHEHGYGLHGCDFLAETAPRARNIVTNPPYGRGMADRFVEHALKLVRPVNGKVVMLLNLASLCHPLRADWWLRNKPARIYALDECECWDSVRYGSPPWRRNTQRYMWVVWDASYEGPTKFGWLSTIRKNFSSHLV